MRQRATVGLLLILACALRAEPVPVPNPSFEQGDGTPAGWTMAGSGLTWVSGQAADGERFVTVTGTGEDNTYWRSTALPLAAGQLCRVSFVARSLTAAGGTAVTGPVFCNRDIGCPPPEWTPYSAVFVCPDNLGPDQSWLRFGQWHVGGTIAFDAVVLTTVQAVHARVGDDVVLGEGETIAGNAYEFTAPLGGPGLNHSRPLARARCGFNSNRWVFGADSEVVYRHRIGSLEQTAARVEVTVGWYSGGQLQAEVSRDGQDWLSGGQLDGLGTLAVEVPAALLPAAEIQVRLKAVAKARVGSADSDPGSFQVHGYRYRADLGGRAPTARGQTLYVEKTGPGKGWGVDVLAMGSGQPGGSNQVALSVTNGTGQQAEATPLVRLRQEGRSEVRCPGPKTALPGGVTVVACPYDLPGSGTWELTVDLGPAVAWSGKAEVYVPEFYDASYGRLLPGSSEAVTLWWASSGWKVPRSRPAPTARGEALRIRAAGNEAEAAQLVLRPAAALRGLTVTTSDLRGPGGNVLEAGCIEVLRVGYVPVTQKTDATSVLADWPDPLPPLRRPLALEAGVNQPLWVRVKVPAGTPAGSYRGALALKAAGYAAEVPVIVDVYGFDLPKRMTCQSAFGFDPGSAWQYQGVSDPAQRRQVLELYWRSFADHHIAPYNPAPMDPFAVTWPRLGNWQGGTRDPTEKAVGQASLRLRDTSATATVSARYTKPITIPAAGVRVQMRYRTETPGHDFLVTFNHHDAGGQWMSGRNHDMLVTGDGSWQAWDRTVTSFPAGARSFSLTLWATRWSEAGEATGGVWFDAVSLADPGTGQALIEGGDFEPADAASLVPEFAWQPWDTAISRALDEFGFNTFAMPVMGLGGGTFHSRHEPELLGFPEASPEYQAAMKAYLGAIDAHLREKGWTEEAFVYWFDEPDPKDYEFVTNGFRKLGQWAPGLRRMLTEQVEEALVGGPNLWCPVTPEFNAARAETRRQEGEQFWWYVCTGPKAPYATLFIDHPGTELRVWLWQTWERAIDGILVWQTNYWSSSCAYPEPDRPQNPYLDPMGWVSGYDTPRGTRQPWGNGDGRFIYPPEAAADAHPTAPVIEGPVDSIRWEMLRDGIEDYEYFVILRRLLQTRGAALDAGTRQRLEALLAVPRSVSVDLTHFTRDPEPIEAHRHLLGEAIADLARR
jgi:hypothetical protein